MIPQQLLVAAALRNCSLVQDENLICMPNSGKAVRYDDGGPAIGCCRQSFL